MCYTHLKQTLPPELRPAMPHVPNINGVGGIGGAIRKKLVSNYHEVVAAV